MKDPFVEARQKFIEMIHLETGLVSADVDGATAAHWYALELRFSAACKCFRDIDCLSVPWVVEFRNRAQVTSSDAVMFADRALSEIRDFCAFRSIAAESREKGRYMLPSYAKREPKSATSAFRSPTNGELSAVPGSAPIDYCSWLCVDCNSLSRCAGVRGNPAGPSIDARTRQVENHRKERRTCILSFKFRNLKKNQDGPGSVETEGNWDPAHYISVGIGAKN